MAADKKGAAKAGAAAVPRRSTRIADDQKTKAEEMHADALAKVKEHFAALGEELQRAEDEEAAAAFRAEIEAKEKATGLMCVMLESILDDDDDDDDSSSEDSEGEEEEDAEEGDDDGESSDEDWAPDGMKEALERALKAFVPPSAAKALEAAQLAVALGGMVPGASAGAAEALAEGAAAAAAGSAERFEALFAATIALGEAPAEETWAADMARAKKLVARLGELWAEAIAAKGKAGLGALDAESRKAVEAKLGNLAEEWGEMGLAFDFKRGAKRSAAGGAQGKGKGKAARK